MHMCIAQSVSDAVGTRSTKIVETNSANAMVMNKAIHIERRTFILLLQFPQNNPVTWPVAGSRVNTGSRAGGGGGEKSACPTRAARGDSGWRAGQ